MQKNWIIWCPAKGKPTVQHASEAIAVNEAKRLAKMNPDYAFFVYELSGCAECKSVSYDVAVDVEQPF